MKFFEAATIKSKAKAAAKALRDLLSEKTLPKTLRQRVENINEELNKTWSDLEGDAAVDPDAKESKLEESANVGNWLEARVHTDFTVRVDDMFASGYLTREERIVLSGAIGQALDAFNAFIQTNAGHLYQRPPWTDAPVPPTPITETIKQEGDKWVLYSKDGSKKLGTFDNEDDAKKREKEIQFFKSKESSMTESEKDIKLNESLKNLADCDLDIAYMPLVETAIRRDGTIPIKIIEPGWGSSGYYPSDVLERDGPKVFKSGLQMFWDHQTPQEEASRPEGSLDNLAAVLTSDARWETSHPAGPGLYANAKVFSKFHEAVEELAPHIGVSIRARGKYDTGSIEGRTGPIIKAIAAAKSVDFVTAPGAGGQILQLFEARRGAAPLPPQKGDKPMGEEDVKKLTEANAQLEKQLSEQATQLARLQEANLLREAGEFAAVELAKAELPQITKNRLVKSLASNPPVKEGKLDVDAFRTRITEAVKAEAAYLIEVTGGGRISGMGHSNSPEPKPEELTESLTTSFKAMGLSESVAKAAAHGGR